MDNRPTDAAPDDELEALAYQSPVSIRELFAARCLMAMVPGIVVGGMFLVFLLVFYLGLPPW